MLEYLLNFFKVLGYFKGRVGVGKRESENGKWMLGSENWKCWFRKTHMLMSANGYVARREHPNFGCFNPTALNLWRLHLFRLNWDWT